MQLGAHHFATQLEIGSSNIFALVFPLLLAAAPLFTQHYRPAFAVAGGTILLTFSILAARSIGVFYLPAAALLLLSAIPFRDHTRAT
jgi:hypothetical protein